MASLRNLAIGILRWHGHRNIAAALRRNARDATRPLALLGITAHEAATPARYRGAGMTADPSNGRITIRSRTSSPASPPRRPADPGLLLSPHR
jgi:hypothetical protein